MKLSRIYDRDISRIINPAVVAQDRTDATVHIEIEEYVFTDEIINSLYRVLLAIKEKTKIDKTGIWINGYYGSGKSHFLKYLHYCIHSSTHEKAFARLVQAVKERDRLKNPNSRIMMDIAEMEELRRWYATAEIEDVLFNAQDVAGANRDRNTFTTIFFNMFNQCRGYNAYNIPLAVLFEKYLDDKGAFDTFKKVLKEETGFDWTKDAADVVSTELDTVLEIAKQCVPELDIISLKATLTNPETYHVDTRRFSREVQEYAETKGDNYRLLFLVDEVSQFINNNPDVLLDLQAIIERISIDCNRKVWVACTAQQTVEEVTEGTKIQSNSDSYGKIMGRFETRVSLESTDPAYITQKRILDKNSEGIKCLQTLYRENKDAISIQFKSGHQTYGGFQKEDEFILSYPFVPYQFKLISQVFDAFQQLEYVVKEVKDNERSVLKITHETAKQTMDWETGSFIPFDTFFNNMMQQNLIHKGNRAISPALELNEVKTGEFARRVVKVLFMVSNLLDKDKLNFASTLDNLTFLMMQSVDENKMQLRNQIEKVLSVLINNNIIREEKGAYYFYNEDEAELSTLIKNTVVAQDFRIEKIRDILFPFLKVENKIRFAGNDFRMIANIDGKQYFGNTGDIQLLFHFYNEDDARNISLNNPANTLSFCFNELFRKDKVLLDAFNQYCKVERYIGDNHSEMTATREKSIANFRSRNADIRKQVIEPKFHDLINKIRFVSGSVVIETNEVNGKDTERYKNVILKHLENVYKYTKLAESLPHTAEELRTKVNQSYNPEQYKLQPLSEPEKLVNDYITRQGNEVLLSDLVTHFSKPPYGWKDIAVIYLVTELSKRSLRDLKYKHQNRFPVCDFVDKALNTRERESLTISATQAIPQELINTTLQAWSAIFNETVGSVSDGNSLFEDLKQKMQKQCDEWLPVKEKCENYPFGKLLARLTDVLQKWQVIREPQRLFESIVASRTMMTEWIDNCRSIQEFIENQLEKYNEIRKFCNDNRSNFESLDEADKAKASDLVGFFEKDNPVNEFRLMVKIHAELKSAIAEKLKTLQSEVLDRYEKGFQELSALIKEYDLPASICADKGYKLEQLKKLNDILRLQNAQLEAGSFFDDERKKILLESDRIKQQKEQEANTRSVSNELPDTPVTVSVVAEPPVDYIPSRPQKILSSKQDVDNYLETLRTELMKLIDANKKIYIK